MAGRSQPASGSPVTRSSAPESQSIPGAQYRRANRSGNEESRDSVPRSRAVEIQKIDHSPMPA